MAIIKVENGVVKKVFSSCFIISEDIHVPGFGNFEKSYTVWSKEPTTIGSIVTVTGKLSMKSKVYEGKNMIDVSINDCDIEFVKDVVEKTILERQIATDFKPITEEKPIAEEKL